MKMNTPTLEHHHRIEIIGILQICFISPFNVAFLDNGTVVFHSQGRTAGEVMQARALLTAYLLSL